MSIDAAVRRRDTSVQTAHLSVRPMLSLLFFACLLCQPLYAVQANPEAALLLQPDGSEAPVFLRGDERTHWHEDRDGYLVTKSGKTGHWVYATHSGGREVETPFVVGRDNPRAAGLRKPDIAAMFGQSAGAQSTQLVTPTAATPSKGTMHNLVLLVNFSDLTIPYSRQQYDDLFNQTGYVADGAVGSVKDYYQEISYGALTVSSTVVEPVTLDYGYAYYGANSGGMDIRPQAMVQEALAKLNARGFDFRTVDGNGDGYIDGLTVIHAGGGEEYSGNDPNYIWSHASGFGSTIIYDGVRMTRYHTEPARRGVDSNSSTWGITRIGVICHETGHFLGLPDLYDTGYDSSGAGSFCLMASGSWGGGDGRRPTHMSAWCKVNLGWVTPMLISSTGSSYSVPHVETTPQVYKLRGPFAANEYFLVENRQGTGFDAALPGSSRGILIWHIDDNQANNDNQTHYKVDLEEASGTQDLELAPYVTGNDSDYFRANALSSFTSSTTPNNLNYSGVSLGLPFAGISASGTTMMFVAGSFVPLSGSVAVNAGAVYTNSSVVPLSLLASGSYPVTSMRFSNDGITWSTWETYSTWKTWTLAAGDGTKTIYAQFVDSSSATSQAADAITLDATAPVAPGAPADAGGYVVGTTVSFSWTAASDALSGVVGYNCQIGTTPGGGEVFAGSVGGALTKSATVALGQVCYCSVQGVDVAGNVGAWSAPSDGVAAVGSLVSTIGQAKGLADSSSLGINSVVVSAIFGDCIYVQQSDRSSAIKITPRTLPLGVQEGSTVDVGGSIRTGANSERYIDGVIALHG